LPDIVLINPRFEASYWGLEHALPLFGKSAAMPVASLPLLAALTPPEYRVSILDENVSPLDFDRIARADIVGITGMSVQRARMREILVQLKNRGVFTVVGGPWVTVDERYFGDLVRSIFVGEAEETWPHFLEDWKHNRVRCRYEQTDPTAMTQVPVPRYELLEMSRYLLGSIQLSRGCPFQCEFCDIIVTFGRRPRLKTSEQIVRELDALRAQGMEIVFIVDDNLIGNKKAVRPLLKVIREWQEANRFPFIFVAEASLDLAEDEGLMRSMVEANILSVFIGIESPNESSLIETKKHQNVRAGHTVIERVLRVQDAGLEVWSGMILGFDHDDGGIFSAQREFLRKARIAQAMVGMLYAIPKTPLHARLAAEGRLDSDDNSPFGTNVIPSLISRGDLRDGFLKLMEEIYHPDAYFERLADCLKNESMMPFAPARAEFWSRHPMLRLKGQVKNVLRAAGLFARLMWRVEDADLRKRYRQEIRREFLRRRDPGRLFGYLIRCAMHYHHHVLTQQMSRSMSPVINSL
jgi:radical SAM superfamily enzyme YgiQ (UPF0313 family)